MSEGPEVPKSTKVFVSYSHDDEAHERRVLQLADRLCERGIDAILDQYETFPERRWPAWCKRQLEDADHVLMVCTETYRRRIDGMETDGVGRGVCWEAPIIQQLLYDAGGRGSRKMIPVLYSDGAVEHIPTEVRGFSHYVVDREDGFEDLCRLVLNRPRRPKPPLGTVPDLPPEERPWLAMSATKRAVAEPASRLHDTSTSGATTSARQEMRPAASSPVTGQPQTPRTPQREPTMTASDNSIVRILHLSDVHVRDDTDWDADPLRRALNRFITEEVRGGMTPDLVALTGDLAFAGTAAEYDLARKWLDDLWPRLGGLARDRLLLVPGNHDVDRKKADDVVARAVQDSLLMQGVDANASQAKIATVLKDAGQRQVLVKRHDDWLKFLSGWYGSAQALPWWQRRIEIRGTALHVAGLDSAWMACGDADRGRLLLGRYQVNQTVLHPDGEGAGWRIALLHHPWSYLAEFDEQACRALVQRHCDLLLRGHLHVPQTERVEASRDCVELAAGCVYEHGQYPNAFQWIELGPGRRVRVHYRAWLHGGWMIDRNQQRAADGYRDFTLDGEPAHGAVALPGAGAPEPVSASTDPARTPQREANAGAPVQNPKTADSERRSAENAERFEDLKRQIGKILRGSTGAMAALQQAFAVTHDGKRDHGDEVAAQVDLLMTSTFDATRSALVDARKKCEIGDDAGSAAAIAKLSKLLLPWLYIAGTTIDNFWCGAYRGGEIVALPAGLDTMAEIIMAGLDRREVLFQGGPWPVGELSVRLSESGIDDRTENTLRDDLWKKLSTPSDFPFESKKDNVKDRAIAILLDGQRKLGKRLYLVCRGAPLREPDRTLYSETMRRVAARYESLCVVELDETDDRQTDDLAIFAALRALLHSVEG